MGGAEKDTNPLLLFPSAPAGLFSCDTVPCCLRLSWPTAFSLFFPYNITSVTSQPHGLHVKINNKENMVSNALFLAAVSVALTSQVSAHSSRPIFFIQLNVVLPRHSYRQAYGHPPCGDLTKAKPPSLLVHRTRFRICPSKTGGSTVNSYTPLTRMTSCNCLLERRL